MNLRKKNFCQKVKLKCETVFPYFENRQQKRLCQFENFHGSLKHAIAKYEQLFALKIA